MGRIIIFVFLVVGSTIYLLNNNASFDSERITKKTTNITNTLLSKSKKIQTISSITHSPKAYHNKNVVISGVVKKTIGVSGYGLYEIADNTGSIFVLTSKGIPSKGTNIKRITGTVNQSLTVGNKQVIAIIEI